MLKKGKLLVLLVGVIILVVGIGLVLYSNSLPQNIQEIDKYNGTYEGNTNLVWLTGVSMIIVSVTCLLYVPLSLKLKIKNLS